MRGTLTKVMRKATRNLTQSRRLNSTLVVADHDNKTLNDATRVAITAASQIGGDVTVLVAGENCGAVAEQASKIVGVGKVSVADNATYAHCIAEPMAGLIAKVGGSYSHVLMGNNSFAKNILPRAAALMDVSQISDVMEIKTADTFTRPMYAGNAICTVQSEEKNKLLTIRCTSFDMAADGGSAPIENCDAADAGSEGTNWVSDDSTAKAGPSLTSASKVVSGGRGMKGGEHFKMLYDLADKIGDCAVGASRAAVDAGYIGNELQVGQTGKVVAPDMYLAVGISGAIQHLAGMKDSKVIAAINKDPEAPIFQIADYGLEADLFKAVPDMNKKMG